MENYKDDVRESRLGHLGSSDGKMLMQIASLGYVPKSAHKRLAICKGLIPQEEIPETAAIRAGNEMEMAIFNHLKETDPRWESNLRWESRKFAMKNVTLICHPDLVRIDEDTKTINIVEVKTTKFPFEATRHTYESQLYVEALIGQEKAKELGAKWKVKLALCVYSTNGLDLTQPIEFDPSRITIKNVRITRAQAFDVPKAITLIDEFLETFDEYYEGDEIESQYLPTNVKEQFDKVTSVLAEIKEREAMVDEFKARLYAFMLERDIKGIKGENFTITRVDATEQKSFDHKRYIEDLRAKYPRKTDKIVAQYTKTIRKNGYVTIKVRDNK